MTSLGHIRPRRFSEKGRSSERMRRKGMGAKAGVYAALAMPAHLPEFQTPFYYAFIVKENEMMAKKFFARTLSVGLSLALCAGMVMPSFAATFKDLQDAVDGNKDVATELEDGRWGYGAKTDAENKTTYGVEAWADENGNRNIKLNEDVEREADKGETSSILIGKDQNVTIDLNGNDIDGKGVATNGGVISVNGGNLTIKDDTAEIVDGQYVSGSITGGNAAKTGGGVSVTENGSLTLNSGAISNNTSGENGGGVYVGKGSFEMKDGLIDGNKTGNAGGGVYLNTELASRTEDKAKFEMTGGTISNNIADNGNGGEGGGIGATLYQESSDPKYNAIVIDGGTITGNYTKGNGGGVQVTNGKVSITNSTISGNVAGNLGGGVYAGGDKTSVVLTDTTISGNEANRGGGVYAQQKAEVTVSGNKTTITGNEAYVGGGVYVTSDATVTVNDGEISGNEAAGGGGVYLYNGGSFIMETGKLYNNEAKDGAGDDVFKAKDTTLKLPSAALMKVIGKDGKPITGWYWDDNDGWSTGKYPYANQDHAVGGTYTGALYLKAAHDQYFNVVYSDGADGTLFTDQKYEVENKHRIPVYDGETPTREGYTFVGWQLADGAEVDFTSGTVTSELILVPVWEEIPEEPGTDIEDPDIPLGGEPDEEELDETAIPLASGPITRAEFIDYLWRHEGEPASSGVCTFTDVPEDHEFVLALAWAEQNGVAAAYEDGSFQPDELVTVGAAEEFLGHFAREFNMTMPKLNTLVGDAEEAVLNCDEVLAEFFGEELAKTKEAA